MRFRKGLITGAEGGIGKELLILFQEKKIPVIGVGRKEGDLSTSEGRKRIRELVEKEEIDLLINNAGFGLYGDAPFLSLEEQRAMVAVNCEAVMELTLFTAKMWIDNRRRGVIVNVSSVAGEFPTPGMAVYGATKAFVTSFSKALDFECTKYGVRVLASLPGQVMTPFAQKAAKKRVVTEGMSTRFAAEQIVKQIEKGKRVWAFNGKYRLLIGVMKRLGLEKLAMKGVYEELRKRQ